MITKKNYKVCISFGDGLPKTTEVAAKNGIEAIDTAKSLHPGARNIHILGLSDKQPEVKHPLFDGKVQAPIAPTAPDVPMELLLPSSLIFENREDQIECCLRLRSEGLTHRAIASTLGIGSTTVSRWIKQYG
jgi:hypothetical protein